MVVMDGWVVVVVEVTGKWVQATGVGSNDWR
jgi:hypothetical protein